MANAKARFKNERPFTTDYAGAWKGHCLTREGAIKAAVKHVVDDGYTTCVIIGPHGDTTRVRYDYATKTITIRAERFLHRPTKQALRRVK